MKTGIAAHFSTTSQTELIGEMMENANTLSQTELIGKMIKKNNKIPEYAKEYKKEYLFIRELNNLELAENIKKYIEEVIIQNKTQPREVNWCKVIIYEMILNLVNFIIQYFNNPTDYRLEFVDWYFIDLIINKDKIIVRGFFYELGLFLEDKVLCEGLLELESRINENEI